VSTSAGQFPDVAGAGRGQPAKEGAWLPLDLADSTDAAAGYAEILAAVS
jgi:hypothetical protein